MKLPAGPTFQAGPILGLNLPAIRSAFTASSGMVIAVGAEVPGIVPMRHREWLDRFMTCC